MILSFNAEGTMRRCLLALSLLSLWTLAMEDTEVSCVFMERCVLPCSFQIGKEIVIHWFKTPRDLRVHSYYHSKNQFGHQDQYYRNRTSVFKDQIRRGHASLQLTSVEVQDEGRYKCHTSTIKGNQESFVNLKVDAPVKEVSLDQVENWISCRSEGIYPEPQLSWSTSPPSNITFTNTTTVERTEQVLYNISSSLMLSAGVYDLLFICTISTRRNRRRATLQRLSHISGPSTGVTITCTSPNTSLTNFSLVWKFNHTQTIVNQTGTNFTYSVSDEWREKVKNVSKSGSLMLKDLSTKQEGMYTCKLSNAEETHITHIHLRIIKGRHINLVAIITALGSGIVLIGLLTTAAICSTQRRSTPSVTNTRTMSETANPEHPEPEALQPELQCPYPTDPGAQYPEVPKPADPEPRSLRLPVSKEPKTCTKKMISSHDGATL